MAQAQANSSKAQELQTQLLGRLSGLERLLREALCAGCGSGLEQELEQLEGAVEMRVGLLLLRCCCCCCCAPVAPAWRLRSVRAWPPRICACLPPCLPLPCACCSIMRAQLSTVRQASPGLRSP